MKLFCVEYPFVVEDEPGPYGDHGGSSVCYTSMRAAISAAKDAYQARDEAEDEMSADRQDIAPLSRKPSPVMAVDLELAKDFVCDLLNGASLDDLLGGYPRKIVATLKYRQGKIVVMGAAEEKESE